MFYQERDFDCVDYHSYKLHGIQQELRGPKPERLDRGQYLVCIGSGHTFGLYAEQPYPALLKDKLKLEVLNLGFGSAGSEDFMKDETLIEYINSSRLAIVQVTSARGASNSAFESTRGGLKAALRSDKTIIPVQKYYKQLFKAGDLDSIKKLVTESRQTWVDSYKAFLQRITVPKILFWFSTRVTKYAESYEEINELFGIFPQLVNAEMIQEIKNHSDEYVECISNRGSPQLLINRFTGQPISFESKGKEEIIHNLHYPSPEMHIDAAYLLEPICKKRLGQRFDFVPPQIQSETPTSIDKQVFNSSPIQLITINEPTSADCPRRFVIFYEEKEGTTALVQLLDNFKQISIIRQVKSSWEPFDSHACGPMTLQNFEQCLELIFNKAPLDLERLNKIYAQEAKSALEHFNKTAAVGFKMRFKPPQQNAKDENERFEQLMIEVAKRHDLVVFLAVRQDVLRWALSKYHGDGTGKPGHLQFKLANGEIRKEEIGKIRVDCNRLEVIISQCERLLIRKQRLEKKFSRAGIEVHPLLYEDFLKDQSAYFDRICKILHINVSRQEIDTALSKGAHLQKVHSDQIEGFVENHEEVLAKFADRFVRW